MRFEKLLRRAVEKQTKNVKFMKFGLSQGS